MRRLAAAAAVLGCAGMLAGSVHISRPAASPLVEAGAAPVAAVDKPAPVVEGGVGASLPAVWRTYPNRAYAYQPWTRPLPPPQPWAGRRAPRAYGDRWSYGQRWHRRPYGAAPRYQPWREARPWAWRSYPPDSWRSPPAPRSREGRWVWTAPSERRLP